MQITSIKPQKRCQKRVNIFIDEKYAFSLDYETLIREKLVVEQKLTQNDLDKLIKKSDFYKWYDKILRFISLRPRSEKEIINYLKKKKVGDIVTKNIIAKLTRKKLLNDVSFAQWFVEQRIQFRPKGRRVLRQELRQKGIDNEVIDSVLNQASNEIILAQKAVEKKLYSFSCYSKDKKREKLIGFLSRRGFSWDTIQRVLSVDEIVGKRVKYTCI